MKRLHRLVIKSFLGPFVMTFFIVLFLLLMQFLWRYIDELVGKGLEFNIIAELLLYASSGLVPLALPLAILLSSLMAFGNMGEYFELTAMKASGISLRRILMPVTFLVILISIGAFFFSNNVLPVTNLKMRSLRYDLKNLKPEVSITEGMFYKGLGDYTIRVNKKDQNKNLLYGITIYDHSTNKGNLDVTIADSGRMMMTADKRNMIITLWNGHKYTEADEGRRRKDRTFQHRYMTFKEQRIVIAVSGFELSRSDESFFKNAYQMLNVTQLKKATDSIRTGLNMRSLEFRNSLVNNSFFKTGRNTVIRRSPASRNMYTSPSTAQPHQQDRNLANSDAYRKAEARRIANQHRPDLPKTGKTAADSIKAADEELVVKQYKPITDFDSVFASFSLVARKDFVTNALNDVSTNQYMVLTSSSNLDYEKRILRRHEIEWHRKFTLSFACLIFLFIGAPLGAIIRKGGLGLPTVISTLLFIIYYIISLTGQKFVEESVLTPFQGMWMSSIILAVAGIFLTYQATNDSAILNIDTYFNWIREKAGLRRGVLLEKKEHVAGRFDVIDISKEQLQHEFGSIREMAGKNLELLKNDRKLFNLARKSFENKGLTYLVEFGVHYNSLIDQAILSKWFRIPYFKKRLSEFPLIDGRITSEIFTRKLFRWLATIIFPIGIIRLFHLRFKVMRVRRNLRLVMELCTGMINLLNSAAIRSEVERMT